jgi:hypothetical protein
MANRCITALILVLFGATVSAGQVQTSSKDSLTSDSILLLTAAQPQAPIRIQEARLSFTTDRTQLEISYNIQNVGEKPIRYVTPVMWTSLGTGGTFRPVQQRNGLLMPGDVIRNGSTTLKVSDKVAQTLKGSVQVLVVLMIESVTFGDGSVYSDDKTSKALLHYFENLSDKSKP